MNIGYRKVKEKYETFRLDARKIAKQVLSDEMKVNVKLDSINAKELAIAKTWELHEDRHPDFGYDWNKNVGVYVRTNPKHFDLSIRHHGILCGLSIGKPTWSGTKMRVDVIEGSPHNHPLKGYIVMITITAFTAYAKLIGAGQVRIMEPINDNVTALYKKYGFTLCKGKGKVKTHLWKNL